MSKTDSYYVEVVPKFKGDFRPCVLEYGISFEEAERKVKWYINDHGLRFKSKGEIYPALVHIKRINEKLPDGYYLFTSVKAVEV